jgi:hypothetical protein
VVEELIRCCLRCRQEPYVPAGKVDGGSAIFAYCNMCIKVCAKCGKAKVLSQFPVDKDSEGWVTWRRTSIIDPNPTHLPVGDELQSKERALGSDDYYDECAVCNPFPEQGEEDSLSALEEEVKALLSG